MEHFVTPPAFARPDLSRWDKIVELQVPGSGYGLISLVDQNIISETERVYGLLSQAHPKKWLYIYFLSQMLNDAKYFSAQIGMNIAFKRLPNDWLYYRLVRRQYLDQIAEIEHGNALLEEVLKGTIIMDPPISLLFDQKLMICFPFHPKLRERYSDQVRGLFPETQLVETNENGPAPVQFEGEKMTLDQITDMSLTNRKFIFKYAGTNPALRSAGHGVHKLLKLGHAKTATLFQNAINSGEPWILQRYEPEKNQVTFLQGEEIKQSRYYTCWRPVYSLYPEPKLVSLAGYFSENWKVHGTSDAVITGVKIQRTALTCRR